jgi:hypothetical protein
MSPEEQFWWGRAAISAISGKGKNRSGSRSVVVTERITGIGCRRVIWGRTIFQFRRREITIKYRRVVITTEPLSAPLFAQNRKVQLEVTTRLRLLAPQRGV